MSEKMIIEQCAPTLAGLKTASLFPCKYDSRQVLLDEIRAFNRLFSYKGIVMVPVKAVDGFALIYIYRPKMLEKDLECMDAAELLCKIGYPPARIERCIAELVRRFQNGETFPHEVGLFLGYPPEDVNGFIENRADHYKTIGCWKVYGDVNAAQRRFSAYKKCTHDYRDMHKKRENALSADGGRLKETRWHDPDTTPPQLSKFPSESLR